MFSYKPPTEVLDETLRMAFDLDPRDDNRGDDRFRHLLDELRHKERERA